MLTISIALALALALQAMLTVAALAINTWFTEKRHVK
tara:strand:- start:1509 stop:1619 length:111 start_codon:yes stop_codon:yes gene_type:complete